MASHVGHDAEPTMDRGDADDEFKKMESVMVAAAKSSERKRARVLDDGRHTWRLRTKTSMKTIKAAAAQLKSPTKSTGSAKLATGPTMKKKKKPASAGGSDTIRYNGSTIYHSEYKGGYRVLFPGEKVVDKLFKWSLYKSKKAALDHIKKLVDSGDTTG